MSDFFVSLVDRDFRPVLALPDVRIVPTHWGDAATGGPEYAIVEVYGSEAALWNCLDWLRYGLEISNEHGQAVWWGYVESVGLETPTVSVSVSLDDVSNSIKVEYGDDATGYSEDAGSIAEYGRKQRVLSVDPVLANSVGERQAVELANSRAPRPVQDIRASGQGRATLRCVGWLKSLGWLYYSRAHGLIEYVGTGSKEQVLGLGVTGAEFWFAAQDRIINDTGLNLGDFEKGQKIAVSGSASNNTTYTVARGTKEGPAGVTVNQLNWSPPHTIYRAGSTSAAEMAWMAAGDRIHITNADGKDGWYRVTGVSPTWLDMWITVAETLGGGSSSTYNTTLWRGHSIALDETPTEEKPGATVTLIVDGSFIGQRILADSAWTVYTISVKLRKVGAPADGVVVTLYSDSSGLPGSGLSGVTVGAASISSNGAWTTFTLTSPVAISASTYYWIIVNRSGSLDSDDYYTVAVDEDAGYGSGYLRLWNGVAWVARAVDASLLFRVEGQEETTDQIAEIVSSAGQFLSGTTVQDASGINTLQFRDGIVDALTELGDLLTIGTSNARRLLCAVERDRSLRVWEEPAYSGTPDYLRRLNGQIGTPQGVALSPGETIAGAWLRVETPIPPVQGMNADPTLLFVERCEYDATTMTYNITPRGAPNVWRLAVAASKG